MTFVPNLTEEKLASIIELDSVPDHEKELFYPHLDIFPLMPTSKNGEWLDVHKENGQSYENFKMTCNEMRNDAKTILLVPLGSFDQNSPDISLLREYTSRYFCTETIVLNPGIVKIEEREDSQVFLNIWMIHL